MRKLTYQGYCGQKIEVDLDTRPNPVHVRGAIIIEVTVAQGLPLRVSAEIRPEGEIVVRGYEWSVQSENPYWHCDEMTPRDIASGFLTVTEAQKRTVWQLWAGQHPFCAVHDNGVGASLQQITGCTREDIERYLGGEMPPLNSVRLPDGTIIGEDDPHSTDDAAARSEAALELAVEEGKLPGAMPADL